jgi:hypothetical protein
MARPLPRGIAPDLLVSQVKNTMPYLFGPDAGGIVLERFPPASTLRKYDQTLPEELTHFEYYELCLSSHYLTCGTPVPTDVDIQIRKKLWDSRLPIETALEMAQLIADSHSWDFTQVSSRFSQGAKNTPWEQKNLSGQLGEWFTVACGAYCALSNYREPEAITKRQLLFEHIRDEVNYHSEIFGSLWRAGEGLQCLITSANIAHNLGDLDRVMDQWDLPAWDLLRLAFYKLGSQPFDPERKLRYHGRLWVAGELYKSPIQGSSMALENHRHYALRKPKSLRSSRKLLVPSGPFFDRWGKTVGETLSGSDLDEVVEALVHGWDRQPKSFGYGRGLLGIQNIHPEINLSPLVKIDEYHALSKQSQKAFESTWSEAALAHMDDIPSRA